jgi:hypothetical protein
VGPVGHDDLLVEEHGLEQLEAEPERRHDDRGHPDDASHEPREPHHLHRPPAEEDEVNPHDSRHGPRRADQRGVESPVENEEDRERGKPGREVKGQRHGGTETPLDIHAEEDQEGCVAHDVRGSVVQEHVGEPGLGLEIGGDRPPGAEDGHDPLVVEPEVSVNGDRDHRGHQGEDDVRDPVVDPAVQRQEEH